MEPITTNPEIGLIHPNPDHAEDRPRIVSTPGTCGGRPRIDGHRITVEDIAVWHERSGMSPEEIVSSYPSINLSEVHAALAYYHEHRDQIEADIREGDRLFAAMKAENGFSLIRRRLEQRTGDSSNDPISP